MSTAVKSGLQIRHLTLEDQNAVVQLFAKSFSEREAMQSYLKNSAETISRMVSSFIAESAQAGLSFVCEDVTNGPSEPKIIGLCICQVYDNDKASDAQSGQTEFPIRALIYKLHRDLLDSHPELFKDGHLVKPLFRIVAVAVDDSYLNRGIAQAMITKAMNLAKVKGYELIFAENTGHVSQKLFKEKFGFKEVSSQVYKDFEFGGKKPFENLLDPKMCIIVEKYAKDWPLADE